VAPTTCLPFEPEHGTLPASANLPRIPGSCGNRQSFSILIT